MLNTKLLLAGPGTGKTTRVKEIVKDALRKNPKTRLLVLSFTNATINDLLQELAEDGVTAKNCMTLHRFALKVNHNSEKYILANKVEEKIVKDFAEKLEVNLPTFCELMSCITFSQMISDCVDFIDNNPAYGREKV